VLAKGFLADADFGPEPLDEGWIGRYRLEGELARGGMGVVYRGYDEELERPVAIKRPNPGMSPQGLERFQREARASAGLRHPNVVATYEVGHDEAGPYLVMELIEGASLREVLAEEGALSPNRAATIALGLCRALVHAHAAGVLHRDVKPGNVLLRRETTPGQAEALLGDFGLAKPLSEDKGPTLTGQILGSPGYMAPEQVRGEALDVRADLYALGSTLYECLAGRPPFETESVVELIKRVETEDAPTPPPPSEAGLPLGLVAITLRCLERRREDRYSDAEELAADLERFLSGAPVLARAPGPLRLARRWARRRWTPLVLVSAAALALGGIGLGMRGDRQVQARERANALLSDLANDCNRFSKTPPPPDVRLGLVGRAKKAIALDPSRANRLQAATLLGMIRETELATEILEESLAATPPGYSELEILHSIQEGPRSRAELSAAQQRALAHAKRWPQLDSDHPFLSWARAREADQAGDSSAALRHYDQAIANGLSGLRLDRGVINKRLGNFETAREDLLAARELDPRHPWPSYNLGLIELELSDLQTAEAHFSRALALDESFLPARSERGLVRLLLGRWREGRADLLAVLTQDPRASRAPRATRQAAWALALASCGQDPAEARLWGHGPAIVTGGR
jgi:tetratricopeptide (TPR) repeat protein